MLIIISIMGIPSYFLPFQFDYQIWVILARSYAFRSSLWVPPTSYDASGSASLVIKHLDPQLPTQQILLTWVCNILTLHNVRGIKTEYNMMHTTTDRQRFGKHFPELRWQRQKNAWKPEWWNQKRRPLLDNASLTHCSIGNVLIAAELTHIYTATGRRGTVWTVERSVQYSVRTEV
jgi:hypothetical protein